VEKRDRSDYHSATRLHLDYMVMDESRDKGAARLGAVVVNYRTAEDTIACVGALGAIDPLVVVDNGSGDGSAAALRAALPAARIVETGANLGFSGGCNAGIRRALADGAQRILLVNSDAWVPADCIARLEHALDERPEIGIVAPAIARRSRPGTLETAGIRFSRWSGRMWNLGAGGAAPARPRLRLVDGVSGCVMLVRRDVFERAGLFDEAFFYSFEDLEFCLRARAAGFGVACVEGATALHEGSRSIGARSPRRVYFATRNHLLVGRRAPAPWGARGLRQGSIVLVNLLHVVVTRPAPLADGLRAFAAGVWHHLRRQYGPFR
jgi:GT2 family glycosyltransferase